ncbi:MAG: FliM/FliN family flagellar motor switch protein [Deltaproteobacteria bacterium]|nr:FliM/FliN family flagellar motor switch protein [Deltaproteobacteria bacterium]
MNPKEPGLDEDFDLGEDGVDPFDDFESDSAESNIANDSSDPFDFSEGTASESDQVNSLSSEMAGSARVNPRTGLAAKATPVSSTSMKSQTAGLANDLPVQMVAVMGKKNISVGELLALKKGEIVELNRFPNEAVDLVANGRLMAKGELVEVDGKLGIRIIKIYS